MEYKFCFPTFGKLSFYDSRGYVLNVIDVLPNDLISIIFVETVARIEFERISLFPFKKL